MRRILIVLAFLLPAILSAQILPSFSSAATEKAMGSLEDIASAIISDAFSPMTHFHRGEIVAAAVPALFRAETLMQAPEIEGDGFTGAALGAGAGLALRDDFMVYAAATGLHMGGSLKFAALGPDFGTVNTEADFSLVSVLAGCGYDLYRSRFLSVPVYLGAQLIYYKAELTPDPVPWGASSIEMRTTGTGLLFGISGGIAVSLQVFKKLKITSYYLYLRNFNGGSMEADISLSPAGPSLSRSYSFGLDPLSAGMLGFDIGFAVKPGFSVTLAAGSLISTLTGFGSKVSDNGVEMKAVVLILSYYL